MTTPEQTPPTLIKSATTATIVDPDVVLPAVQAILAEARAWGILGIDLEWDKYGRITWIGLGTAKRAMAFWRYTLPEAALQLMRDAMADVTLPKLGHNGIQADRVMWERDIGPVSGLGSWQDCHLDSETEFLTDHGWLRYAAVKDGMRVAAFDVEGRLSFELPLARVSKLYTGRLHVLQTMHTCCAVTDSHRMWVRPRKRTSASWAGAAIGPWGFTRAADMLTAAHDVFDARVALTGLLSTVAFDGDRWNDAELLQLAALFVTDGCVRFRNGSPYSIIITQIAGGRANKLLCALAKKFSSTYRERTIARLRKGKMKRITECIWTFNDASLVTLLHSTFGRYSVERRLGVKLLSTWSLGARKLFFDTLFLGDGSVLPSGTWRAATFSRALADDIQFLALSCGYTATVGRSGNTYNVSCRKCAPRERVRPLRARAAGQNAAFKRSRDVRRARVVCFTTPTGTLVTRSKGKPAFHGNSMLLHHAAFPGVAHDLQQVVSQFLVVPPWKAWRREAERQMKVAAKAHAAQEKAIAKAKIKEAKAAEALAAKAKREAAKFDNQRIHQERNALLKAAKATEKAAAKAAHAARNAELKAAKAVEKAAAQVAHAARNATLKAEKAARKSSAKTEKENAQ